MWEYIPDESWTIISIAIAGLILLIGLRLYKLGFRLKLGRNREFDCDNFDDDDNKKEE